MLPSITRRRLSDYDQDIVEAGYLRGTSLKEYAG